MNWSHRLSLTIQNILCVCIFPPVVVSWLIGDQLRDYFWYQVFEIWYHCLLCFGQSTLKLSYNSRGCVSSVFVFTVSAVNYNMFVSPVMVTKKRLKEGEREDSGRPNKHLCSPLIDQEVAGGLQYDQQIWSIFLRVYVSKCISFGHYLNPD